jgi:DNA-binding CsgD family transcriptional regulator
VPHTGSVKTYHAESARAGLEAAAAAGLPWDEFCLVATELLARAIPHDSVCLGTADPASRLLTGRVKVNMGSDETKLMAPDETVFMHYEYGVPDYNHFSQLADRPVAVGILDEATDGKPLRSPRYRDLLAAGGLTQELRGVVRSDGAMWGFYTLYRQSGQSGFSPAEADFMHRIEHTLAAGVRRGLIASAVGGQAPTPKSAAVIIFDSAGQVVSATPTAEERIAELGGDLWSKLPAPVTAARVACRAATAGLGTHVPALRIRSRTGEWLSLHAAPIRDRDGLTGQIAVTIETAGAAKIIPLIVAAYGLTDRERDVVQQVLEGASTNQIAAHLHLSPYTIQDHLKTIFDKVGVASRRELSSQIFFGQYAARMGDNLDSTGWFAG